MVKEDLCSAGNLNSFLVKGIGKLKAILQRQVKDLEMTDEEYLYFIFQSDFDIEKYVSEKSRG